MIDFSNRFYLKIKLPRKTDKKQIYMQNNYFYYYMQEQHGNVSVFMHFMQILCNPKKRKAGDSLSLPPTGLKLSNPFIDSSFRLFCGLLCVFARGSRLRAIIPHNLRKARIEVLTLG